MSEIVPRLQIGERNESRVQIVEADTGKEFATIRLGPLWGLCDSAGSNNAAHELLRSWVDSHNSSVKAEVTT